MPGLDYLLFEEAAGYAIFKVTIQQDEVSSRSKEVQESASDLARFSKMIELVSFAPFKGAAQALENANDISEGLVSDYLKSVLELNIPKGSSKNRVALGVSDRNLGPSVKEHFPYIDCFSNEIVQDFLRGIRTHGVKLLKELQEGDLERAQLGLGHAFSRAKVKFSVQKNDNHIIQAIALLDQLDKDINTFSMRVKEWYGWHFPELAKITPDNLTFAKLALFIQNKSSLTDESLHDVAAIVNDDSALAEKIINNARISMGQDISEIDMMNVSSFAKRVVSITEYRATLYKYLTEKMNTVAPNLSTLIGEVVGARLISHAGSLTNLSKQAASTVQILGAEKALFRALKTKGNTPKYGLIYHSSFIGKASTKNKGRISRYLANKCSIASRIDNYSDEPSSAFGTILKKQVEERLNFYNTGAPPMKNADAVKEALALSGDLVDDTTMYDAEDTTIVEGDEKKDKKSKKEKKEKKEKKDKKEKKEKKDKKDKKRKADDEESPKKKKKKSKD
ncbi:Nucleolar protein 56 [Yamadazyma tenuis]|uniref:Nucleolar protein 56 n=1 Tax=Candida tenuis (strain ATCC 10573 / BCRC 21748 / CBS 615 / JCM 9827 / NBRC 10315 / NRRL Y-1498 / VKM Y-70) TaxID=590646 RepID=G3AWT8_CANTC|nr:Nop-domain-containing protein [Yamadazyma tenuis ATCC 10573]EGV66616.1 Nop-domain-containing protein [Yamadazyma tenuis ATCC 10573]WEJ95260.1 Nucleolar protein 56 [Yamadazyma tenuis]